MGYVYSIAETRPLITMPTTAPAPLLAIRPGSRSLRILRMSVAPAIQAAQTGSFTVSVGRQAASTGPQNLSPVLPQPMALHPAAQITSNTAATTIAAGSNGQSLPQGTINVASTTGFPSSGRILVTITGSPDSRQVISYTGTTALTFTGCTGGSGTLATGHVVNPLWTTLAAAQAGVLLTSETDPTEGTGYTPLFYQTSLMQPGWLWTPTSTEAGLNDEIIVLGGGTDCLVIRLEVAPTTASANWRVGMTFEELV
jgi:hypothetical protein